MSLKDFCMKDGKYSIEETRKFVDLVVKKLKRGLHYEVTKEDCIWVEKFLLVAIFYIFNECDISSATKFSIMKLYRHAYDDEYLSVFDILLDDCKKKYASCVRSSLCLYKDYFLGLIKDYDEVKENYPKHLEVYLEEILDCL